MANSLVVKTELDGPGITILSVTGLLDTSDISSTTLIDAANLEPMDPILKNLAAGLGVSRIEFDIEDGLIVNLYFEASPTSELIKPLTGRGKFEMHRFGWQRCLNAGKTGKILISTQGFTAGGTFTFGITLYLRKQAS